MLSSACETEGSLGVDDDDLSCQLVRTTTMMMMLETFVELVGGLTRHVGALGSCLTRLNANGVSEDCQELLMRRHMAHSVVHLAASLNLGCPGCSQVLAARWSLRASKTKICWCICMCKCNDHKCPLLTTELESPPSLQTMGRQRKREVGYKATMSP